MGRRFDAFVLFAEMRTGSNHLEETLNTLDDVACHGELFNPTFIGHQNQFSFRGHDLPRRERDPMGLIAALRDGPEMLPGFRYFHDHDPRVLDPVLSDARIAKVILTRNPLDSYISRKIAAATGQWRLTDLKHARTARATFDPDEFESMLRDWATFRDHVRRALQTTGQTPFHIRHEDINDVDVLNGLAAFLGSEGRLSAVSDRLKRQNPGSPRDKVDNPAEMEAALVRMDRFGLGRVIEDEAPRPPGVPGFIAHPDRGLLILPVAGGPTGALRDWLAGIGGVGRDALLTGMTQKDLRIWMRRHPGFVSLSVVRDPAMRVLQAYDRMARATEPRMVERRSILASRYAVPFAEDGAADAPALLAFAEVLKGNLAGQTSFGTLPDWATQTSILQGAAQVALPHRILREEDAREGLAALASGLGLDAPAFGAADRPAMETGAVLRDEAFVKVVETVYRRDYIQFGYPLTA